MWSGQVARRYGSEGLPDDTIHFKFTGSAGQSFGAFLAPGLCLELEGDANDYVGKGLSGGRVIVYPPKNSTFAAEENILVGNTCLYGATGGEFFAAGLAGERFAVRNSGVTAVVEGTGHHLCEYMTRGIVVVLGDVGYNVGAGMTGGVIHILDEAGTLGGRLSNAYVEVVKLEDGLEIQELKSVVEDHYRHTESPSAGKILSDFRKSLRHFKKVVAR